MNDDLIHMLDAYEYVHNNNTRSFCEKLDKEVVASFITGYLPETYQGGQKAIDTIWISSRLVWCRVGDVLILEQALNYLITIGLV